MTKHIARAAVVKVSIGSPSGNSVAQFVRRGDVLPEGLDGAQIERLLERRLIEVAEEILEAEVVEVELPKATDSHDEIDAFAAEYSIDLSGLGDKPNREAKVTEIERVVAERTATAEATGVLQ